MKEMFSAVWSYRHFIVSSIKNDLRSRFARSKLGGLWLVLQPLAQVAIFALILSRIMAGRLPGIDSQYAYVMYLISGIVAWSLFAEVVNRSLTVFVDSGNLMKKMVFPRACLPLIVAGSSLVSNLILLVTASIVFVLIGHPPSLAMIWLPLLIGVNLVFGLGLGLVLGVLNVFVRDVGQVMGVVLQLWFWLTPVVYMPSIIPEGLRNVLPFNPMTHIVTAFQDVMLYGQTPSVAGLAVIAGVAALTLLFALVLFRRAAPEMVDVL